MWSNLEVTTVTMDNIKYRGPSSAYSNSFVLIKSRVNIDHRTKKAIADKFQPIDF